MAATDNGEIPKGELGDDLTCECKFYRSYQLPCSHLWQYQYMQNCFQDSDWERWQYMFEDCGFEVYEGTTKTFAINEIHDQIDGPSKYMLEVREVLDDIKRYTKFTAELPSDSNTPGSIRKATARALRTPRPTLLCSLVRFLETDTMIFR